MFNNDSICFDQGKNDVILASVAIKSHWQYWIGLVYFSQARLKKWSLQASGFGEEKVIWLKFLCKLSDFISCNTSTVETGRLRCLATQHVWVDSLQPANLLKGFMSLPFTLLTSVTITTVFQRLPTQVSCFLKNHGAWFPPTNSWFTMWVSGKNIWEKIPSSFPTKTANCEPNGHNLICCGLWTVGAPQPNENAPSGKSLGEQQSSLVGKSICIPNYWRGCWDIPRAV